MDSRPISSSSSTPISPSERVRKDQTPSHQRVTPETMDKAPMSKHQFINNALNREASPHRLQRQSVDDVPVTEAALQEVFDAATTNFERRLDQKFRHANEQFAASLKEVGTKLSSEIDTRTHTASVRIQGLTDAVEANIAKIENINQTMKKNIKTMKETHQRLEEGHKKREEILGRTQARQEARRAKREAGKSDPKS